MVFTLSCPRPIFARADSAADLKRDLQQAIGKKNLDRASRLIEELILLGTADAMEAICDYAFSADDAQMEKYAIDKLSTVPTGGEAILKLSEIAKRHKDFRVRVALMNALGMRSEQEAVTALHQGLYDGMLSVARAALESVKTRDSLLSIDALIDALEHQEQQGRSTESLHFEIRSLLTYLTAESFESAIDWRNFWSARKDNFQRPTEAKRAESRTGVKKDAPVFFEHEVASSKLLFVLDVSGSMKKRDPLPEEVGEAEKKKEGGKTGVPKKDGEDDEPDPPKQEDIPQSRERLARVQKELIATIEKLPAKTKFNILTFSHKVELFRPEGLIDGSKVNKQRAIEFVRNFRPEGETHTDEALEKAFEFRDIDSIFLLSDGAPRRDDKLLETAPILERVRDLNRFRRIRVFTVGFEQAGKSLREFMRRLAYQNGGSYRGLR
ncbi:MAG: VWA domain-containing protein [Planctomycetota bacterium]